MNFRNFFIIFLALGSGWFAASRMRDIISFCAYPFVMVNVYVTQPVLSGIAAMAINRDYERLLCQYQAEMHTLLAAYVRAQARSVELQALVPYAQDQHPYYATPARIIYRDLAPARQILIIDKGTLHGIERDMIAVEHQCLVGRVVEVYPWYSKILLITHPHCKVPAVCSESLAHGVHHGNGSADSTHLAFVSHLEDLHAGELVLSSGDGLVYPAGYALGTLKQFRVHDLGYLLEVDVQPVIDVQTINHCVILSKGTHHAAD